MKMRPSRIFRWIVRIFLGLLTLSMTIVSLLGGYSAFMILGDPNNIKIPSGPISANFNITDPSGMSIIIPFNLTNAGYFDLTNLQINIKIDLTFGNLSLGATSKVNIFDHTQTFPPIIRGQTYSGLFNGTGTNFIEENFPNVTTEVDLARVPVFEFHGNFTISAYYSLDLLAFAIGINNVTLGEFTP